MELKKGNSYVIIPATEKAGCTSEFFLSIYVSCPLRDVEIKRTFHPSQNPAKRPPDEEILPTFIKEEAEKQYTIPPWKMELVHKMLPYMMTETDETVQELDNSD
jgi:hypothetical protein